MIGFSELEILDFSWKYQTFLLIEYFTVKRSNSRTMYDLTGFQRDLLYVVSGLNDPKGLEIKEELEPVYEGEIHHGRLYPNLDTLVEKGLIDKGELDQRTNYYTLTRRGSRELEARRDWEQEYLGDEFLD